MSASFEHAIGETLDYLIELEAQQTAPAEVATQLASLRARHPTFAIDVTWQTEEHELRRSYDAFMRNGKSGTVALSWCPDRGVPFALRGMQRASQRELVRVNGVPLEVDEAAEALEFLWGSVRLLDRILDTCIVKAAVRAEPIDVEVGELEQAVEQFRVARGLFSAAATEAWLAQRGLTQEMLEGIVSDDLMLRKLRHRVTAVEVERRLRESPAYFDRIDLFHFEVGDEEVTTRLADEVRHGGVPFFAAAERVLTERAATAKGGCACGSGVQLSHYMRSQLFFPGGSPSAGDVGSVIVFREDDKPFSVARVMSISPATPESVDRDEIENMVFEEWLAERRRGARIQWNFGSAGT
jgi:putative peptide maturation system protein